VPLQRRDQAPVVGSNRGIPRHDHQVHSRQAIAVASEGLACETFESVTVYRATRLFLRDGQTETGCTGVGDRRCQYRKVGIGRFQRLAKDPLEIPRLGQAS